MGLDVYDDIERYMAGGPRSLPGAHPADRPSLSSVVVSGHDVGHIGPADIIVGFDRLCRAAFGFGLITPPAG